MTFEQLIAQQRETIDQIVSGLCRKYFLAAGEIEEFRRVAEHALERNHFELLRAFEGKSTWATYLETVLTREFYQFQAALWGDWRPSPTAVRLGPAAMLLEELVGRDRFSVPDAIEWMRTTHRVDVPRHKIQQYAERLALVGPGEARRAGVAHADSRLSDALRDAMALISPDDRLIVQLRFRDHQPLTRIARMLNADARPLQRRIDLIKDNLRHALLTQGIAGGEVDVLLQNADSDAVHPSQQWWNLVLSGPSK